MAVFRTYDSHKTQQLRGTNRFVRRQWHAHIAPAIERIEKEMNWVKNDMAKDIEVALKVIEACNTKFELDGELLTLFVSEVSPKLFDALPTEASEADKKAWKKVKDEHDKLKDELETARKNLREAQQKHAAITTRFLNIPKTIKDTIVHISGLQRHTVLPLEQFPGYLWLEARFREHKAYEVAPWAHQ